MIELFIGSLITQIALLYIFSKLTDTKAKLSLKNIIIILISSELQVLLNSYDQNIGTLFTIIYFYIIFQKLFNINKEKSRNYTLILWSLSILIDVGIMFSVNSLGFLKYYELNKELSKMIGSIIMSLILLLLGNIKPVKKKLNNIYKKLLKLKFKMTHLTIIIITFMFIGFMSSENIRDKFVVTILLIAGFAILVVIISFVTMKYQLILFKKTNEILEKNDIVNRKVITQYRVLKHNLESKLMGVKTVSNDEAKQLIDEMILDYNSSFFIKHDVNAMPLGINGFVFEKLYKYQDENLDISVTNKIKNNILDSVGSRNYNLFCEALGVTLDNALEASKNSQEKLFYLEFNETNDKVTIKVINTFSGDIELDKLGTVQYTTKEKGHGFGLFSLIGRKNLTITTSIKNNRFINFLEIKKKNNQETK